MSDEAVSTFLSQCGWTGASRTPIAGDASGRRYERLQLGATGAVLMQAPDGSASEIRRFSDLARHLRSIGLSAPAVLGEDPESGLMLLEDLGSSLYSEALARDPGLASELYRSALDALIVLQAAPAPPGLTVFTPTEMAAQATLAATAYAMAPEDAPCPFENPLCAALSDLSEPPRLMLRDFHAENLFWLPRRPGVARVGLIDFQDARLADPLYDVVSLLWDARRDLTDRLRRELLERHARSVGRPVDTVEAEAATLSLQRNLRILGIFARLAVRKGQPSYLVHIPRVWGHVESALKAPHLADLRGPVLDTLPPPTKTHLDRFKTTCPTP